MHKEHHYGIDLLRITASVMICVLHILGFGGVIQYTSFLSSGYIAAWGLEKMVLCCVNCYGLLSGYIGLTSRHRPSSYIVQWLQAVFYSFGITLIFAVFQLEKISLREYVLALLPVSANQFWYFSSYSLVWLLMPLLNRIVLSGKKQTLGRALIGLSLLLCLPSALFNLDPFSIRNGFSPLWLTLLYLIGAYIRRWSIGKQRPRLWLAVYLLSSGCLFALKIVVDVFFLYRGKRILEPMFSNYISPFALLCGIALLIFFASVEFRSPRVQKALRTLSSASFGVYLIHVHPLVWDRLFLSVAYAPIAQWPVPVMLLGVVAASVGLYLVCWLIDYLRIRLFEVLRVPRLADALGAKLEFSLQNTYTGSEE